MDKQIVNQLSDMVLGNDEEFSMSARILNGGCLVAILFGFLTLIINNLLNLAGEIQLYIAVAMGLSIVAWIFGRVLRLFIACVVTLVAMQIFTLSGAYFFNGGSSGPTIFYYIATIPLYLFLLKPLLGTLVSLLLFINIITIYLMEYYDVITPVNRHTDLTRIPDILYTISFSVVLIATIIIVAKKIIIKEKEKAIKSNEAKTRFLANISHEIRTPLNAVINMNAMALDRTSDTTQKQWLEISQISAEYLSKLIEDVLDLSSIDQEKLILNDVEFNLEEILNESISIINPSSKDKRLNIKLTTASNIPRSLKGDCRRIQQVIVNLLHNAVKFTEEGDINVSAKIESEKDDTVNILIAVTDTGSGIDPEDRERIFEIFSQGKNQTATQKGFGLGLAISRSIIEFMKGRIWFVSKAGEGTSFYIVLPLKINRNAPNKDETTPTISIEKNLSNRLLLVEDNEINAEVALHILQKADYDVDIAINGKEALKLLEKSIYGVILMDLEMPILDGFETTIQLRQGVAGPLNQKTPVVAVTAHALNEHREKCFESGMQGFIAKPYTSSTLLCETAKYSGSSFFD